MRWIRGGILLTTIVSQCLVWASGHGVERGHAPIAWGPHESLLSEDLKELVAQEMLKQCPGIFQGHSLENPKVISALTPYQGDDTLGPAKRFFVEFEKDPTEASENHWLAVILQDNLQQEPSARVMVLPLGDSTACKVK